MGKKPASFSEIQYAEMFSYYKKQHGLDLFCNTNFQIGHHLAENVVITPNQE